MSPATNDFSNRRRPSRRGEAPGSPRDVTRGRSSRRPLDPRKPGAASFRRRAPNPEGDSAPEPRRWSRNREEAPASEGWRRGEGGGRPRPSSSPDRQPWRVKRREEGASRPVFRGSRGEGPGLDSQAPQGEAHAAAAPSELIWGRHAALAALEGGRPIHRVWCTPEMRFRPTFLQLLREAKASGVLVEEVSWARLGQISGGAVHQGIVLQPAAADTLDLPSLIEGCRQLGEAPLLVAVDGLTDPQNLGAILRSAEAMGVHGLVLPQRRNAGLTGSVAKVAAGALEHLPVARVVNLNRALDSLRQEGYRVVGLDPQGSVSLEEADLEGPLVVITGSEGQGLSLLTRRSCDQLVRIPLRGATPSLNASVATALVLYEVARRGWMRGLKGTAPAPRLVRPVMANPPVAPRAEDTAPPRAAAKAPAAVEAPSPPESAPEPASDEWLGAELEPTSPQPPEGKAGSDSGSGSQPASALSSESLPGLDSGSESGSDPGLASGSGSGPDSGLASGSGAGVGSGAGSGAGEAPDNAAFAADIHL